jgi:hypothetical protein
VKWLDEEGDVCEWECDDEEAARAFGGSLLKFRPDMETSLLMAGWLMRENPELSPEEAMERVGIVEVELSHRGLSSQRTRRLQAMGEAKRRKPRNDVRATIRLAVKNFGDPDVREALRLTAERAETDPEARQAIERIRAIEVLLRGAAEHLNSESLP